MRENSENQPLADGNGVVVLEPKEALVEMHNHKRDVPFTESAEMPHTRIGRAVMCAIKKFPQADIKRVKRSLAMLMEVDYVYRLDACMLYLEANYGREYVKKFRLDDPKTLAVFQRGDTEGVHRFSSEKIRAKLSEAQINSIDDIVDVYRDCRHPKLPFWPYSLSLVQVLVSYFGVYIKCHYPKEYNIFIDSQSENWDYFVNL